MKKKTQSNKLSLSSEKIRLLGVLQLKHVDGGELPVSKMVKCGSIYICQ